MTNKLNTIAIGAVLIALATSEVAVPAFAKDTRSPGFDACFALAVDRGSGPNKGGGTKEDSQYKAFMSQCMEGKIPLDAAGLTNLPANIQASRRASH